MPFQDGPMVEAVDVSLEYKPLAFYSKTHTLGLAVFVWFLSIAPSFDFFNSDVGMFSIFNRFPLVVLFYALRFILFSAATLIFLKFIRSLFGLPAISYREGILKVHSGWSTKAINIKDVNSHTVSGSNINFLMESGDKFTILCSAFDKRSQSIDRICEKLRLITGTQ